MSIFTLENAKVLGHTADPAPHATMQVEADNVSDQYHSMHELYEYRMALHVALCRSIVAIIGCSEQMVHTIRCYKAREHFDGSMFDGYFIVVIMFKGKQITNHYDIKHWDKFDIPEVPRVLEPYDGHTTRDCIERLLGF